MTRRTFAVALTFAAMVGCQAQGSITPVSSPAPGGASSPATGASATPNASASTSNSSGSSTMSPMPGMDATGTPAASSSAGPAAMAQSVTIQNFAFSPANVTVMRGGTVTWTNKDNVGHTATSDTAGGFDTGIISPGGTSAAITFSTPGTFPYHCSVHPGMKGTITVQ